MSGPSDFQPNHPALKWIERRLPIMGLMHSSFVAYPTPRNLNYWWTFGAILSFMLAIQIVDRRDPGDALHALCRSRLQVGRTDRARRQLRLAAAQHARLRRLDVLPRRLHPHVPRPVLRVIQGAARNPLDPRRDHLPPDDGDRLHGLRAAVGPDELLGRHRHHQSVLGHSLCRREHRDAVVGRLRRRQPDAEPLLLAALPAAFRDRRRGRAARLGAACRGPEQSRWRRAEDRKGHRAVHAARDHQGLLRRVLLHAALRLVHLLHAELSRRCRQLHPGQSRRDACTHRARMVLFAVLRHPAFDPEQARRCRRDVRRDHHSRLPALARHRAGPSRRNIARWQSSSSGSSW